jgi:hypothetical protein
MATEALPPIIFTGPQRLSQASWNSGPIHAMTLIFYPEAWAAISGTTGAAFFDRSLPIDHAVSGELLTYCSDVFAPGTCEERLQ